MNLIKKFKAWLFFKRHGYPSQEEAMEMRKLRHTVNIEYAVDRYAKGASLEDIAFEMYSTRERVRQLLNKARRKLHSEGR